MHIRFKDDNGKIIINNNTMEIYEKYIDVITLHLSDKEIRCFKTYKRKEKLKKLLDIK